MSVFLFIVMTVAGAFITIEAPDSFGWRFDVGLGLMICGLIALPVRAAYRLLRSPKRWRRGIGGTLAALLVLMAILAGVLWSNYHLLIFRRPSVEDWRADLQALPLVLEQLPNGLRERARQCVLPELASLSRDVAALTADQRHARLIHAIACLDDGHSMDFPFFPVTDFSPVPLQIRSFDDGWFVTRAAAAQSWLVGLQVTKIGGLDVEDAFQRMRPYISADNEDSARVHAPIYMLCPRLWNAIGVTNPPDALDFDLVPPSGSHRQIRLHPAARARYLWWYLQPGDWVFPPKPPAGSPPSAEWKREPWWLTPMPERHAIYVAFRSVRNRREETLTAFAARLLQVAGAMHADRLVIDVRDNSGGDNTLFRGFVSAIAASEFNDPGRLFLLINGGTFSAATNFVTSMERKTHVILVGAPTGSGPNHFGDPQMQMLPRTHIALFLSTRRHQFGDPADNRTAHQPQLRIRTTSQDYFSGHDAALEAALGR